MSTEGESRNGNLSGVWWQMEAGKMADSSLIQSPRNNKCTKELQKSVASSELFLSAVHNVWVRKQSQSVAQDTCSVREITTPKDFNTLTFPTPTIKIESKRTRKFKIARVTLDKG